MDFKIKESPIESIKKARLVVQGNYQVPGRDFMETYAPTICKESLRSLIGFISLRRMTSIEDERKKCIFAWPD
jgi:hypothetical protein